MTRNPNVVKNGEIISVKTLLSPEVHIQNLTFKFQLGNYKECCFWRGISKHTKTII